MDCPYITVENRLLHGTVQTFQNNIQDMNVVSYPSACPYRMQLQPSKETV